jgi:hypothetical protein
MMWMGCMSPTGHEKWTLSQRHLSKCKNARWRAGVFAEEAQRAREEEAQRCAFSQATRGISEREIPISDSSRSPSWLSSRRLEL